MPGPGLQAGLGGWGHLQTPEGGPGPLVAPTAVFPQEASDSLFTLLQPAPQNAGPFCLAASAGSRYLQVDLALPTPHTEGTFLLLLWS